MPTIIATLGAADSNSLVSVEDADAYFDLGLGGGAWGELSDDTKARALVEATRRLETLRWHGRVYTSTQGLAWPRYWAGMSDGLTLPKAIAAACCHLALYLAQADAAGTLTGTQRQQMIAEGVTSYRNGDRSETFASGGGASDLADPEGSLPSQVRGLLQGWINRAGMMDSGRRPAYGGNYDQFGQWWPRELMP